MISVISGNLTPVITYKLESRYELATGKLIYFAIVAGDVIFFSGLNPVITSKFKAIQLSSWWQLHPCRETQSRCTLCQLVVCISSQSLCTLSEFRRTVPVQPTIEVTVVRGQFIHRYQGFSAAPRWSSPLIGGQQSCCP